MKFVKSLPSELYKLDSQYRTLVENGFIIERGYTICSSPRQAADLADGIAFPDPAEVDGKMEWHEGEVRKVSGEELGITQVHIFVMTGCVAPLSPRCEVRD